MASYNGPTNVQQLLINTLRELDDSVNADYFELALQDIQHIGEKINTKNDETYKIIKGYLTKVAGILKKEKYAFCIKHLTDQTNDEIICEEMLKIFKLSLSPERQAALNKRMENAKAGIITPRMEMIALQTELLIQVIRTVDKKCEFCNAKTSQTCACKQVLYCSRKCQKSDYPLHRLTCKKIVDGTLAKFQATSEEQKESYDNAICQDLFTQIPSVKEKIHEAKKQAQKETREREELERKETREHEELERKETREREEQEELERIQILKSGSCCNDTEGATHVIGELLLCTRCKMVVYCCKKCQKQHWKTHSPFCIDNRK